MTHEHDPCFSRSASLAVIAFQFDHELRQPVDKRQRRGVELSAGLVRREHIRLDSQAGVCRLQEMNKPCQ